jgi:type IV pilus assembly protein PilM
MLAFSAKDEISSTEKLLDVIRGRASGDGSSEKPKVRTSHRIQTARTFLRKVPFFHKRINVGVDIGYTNLTLVKMLQLSEYRYKLLDYQSVPFNPNVPKHSPDFHQFLRSAVLEFCGSLRSVNLWTSISASQVDVGQIRIPRVAQKELFKAIFWTAKREMNFDEKESVFDFEIQGEVIEDGIPKTKVMTYAAPKDPVKETRELFAKSGLPLAGVTTTSFAVQNLFRTGWVAASNTTTCANLYLSDAYSRIAIFSGGNLVLTREIKTGVDSLIISIVESFNNNKEAPSSLDALERKLDALEINWEKAVAMLFSRDNAPHSPREEGAVAPEDEGVLELVGPALERLIRQIERTFEFFTRVGRGEHVEKIFISGAVGIRGAIVDHIGQSLGVKTELVDPLNPANLILTKVRPPVSLSERALYTSTLGLALSDNARTPNLLFTFDDKERHAAIARTNRSIFVVFMAVISILAGIFFWQEHLTTRKQAEISKLEEELAQYNPLVNQNLIMQIASKVKSDQQMLRGEAEESLGIAVLSELSALTPDNIRLIGITTDLGRLPEAQEKDGNSGQRKSASKSLVIDGIVQGDSQTLEASLARYLMRLGSSLVFVNPAVHSSSLETYQEVGEALRFVLKMGLVDQGS